MIRLSAADGRGTDLSNAFVLESDSDNDDNDNDEDDDDDDDDDDDVDNDDDEYKSTWSTTNC